MSAFFFCGIIELPVACASSSTANPNSDDVHSTHSSPSRERCTPRSARSNNASATKSRSLTASSEFSNAAAKPRSAAVPWGSSGNDDPASAPAPKGDTSRRSMVTSRRSTSRRQRPAVREQVMSEEHGLRALHVRVAGQVRVAGGDRPIEEHLLQPDDPRRDGPELALAPEPQRGRHLVVSAPARVELPARGAGDLGDPSFDRGVDVLVRRCEVERSTRRARPRRHRGQPRSPRPRPRRAGRPARGRARAPASLRCRPRPAADRTATTP